MTTKPTPIPARVLPNASPAALLATARRGLDEATETRPDGLRYASAHLAALRAAAAVIAVRALPTPGRQSGSPDVWVLLTQVAPELEELARPFGAGREPAGTADERLRQAREFVAAAESIVGEAGVQ